MASTLISSGISWEISFDIGVVKFEKILMRELVLDDLTKALSGNFLMVSFFIQCTFGLWRSVN